MPGVVTGSDGSQLLDILRGEGEVRVLEFPGIAHVQELVCNAQVLVDGVVVLDEVLRPRGNAQIIGSVSPSGCELPN